MPGPAFCDLVETGQSEPRYHPNAVLFFSDFAGFTTIAAAPSPRQVIEELSDLFANFDEIMAAHGCDRIETIGDAYLAVAGLRQEADGSAEDSAGAIARAALAVQAYLRERNRRVEQFGVCSGGILVSESMFRHLELTAVAGEFSLNRGDEITPAGKGPMKTWSLDSPAKYRTFPDSGQHPI